MKCLLKYQWVKLPRNQLPPGKGVMAAWARLASRVAFRNGQAVYCGHVNQVSLGTWSGGVVGLKSILGIKNRQKALETLDKLSALGYLTYELDGQTKKLTYQIKDWVVHCSGAPCMGDEAVYATPGYGFLCLPRNITQRLAEAHYQFDESDAWLDLWCHTVWQDPGNAFSHTAPAVQYGQQGAVLTLEAMGRRWGWEKTKVWRFFQKHADAFPLVKLPGSFGCLVFNTAYPTGSAIARPNSDQVERILTKIRIAGRNAYLSGTDHERLCRLVAWYSKAIVRGMGGEPPARPGAEGRVALSSPIIRAYLSPCQNCRSGEEDWRGKYIGAREVDFDVGPPQRAGPDSQGGIEYGTFEGIPLW